jgi:hypothetical protein
VSPTGPTTRLADTPTPLVVAASVTAAEGLVMGGYAVLELASLSSGRVTMGLTTALFFAAYAASLLLCAWQLTRGVPWARSPIVLAQLIQLGLAWNFRGDGTTPIAVALALIAVIVLAGLFHPASVKALER